MPGDEENNQPEQVKSEEEEASEAWNKAIGTNINNPMKSIEYLILGEEEKQEFIDLFEKYKQDKNSLTEEERARILELSTRSAIDQLKEISNKVIPRMDTLEKRFEEMSKRLDFELKEVREEFRDISGGMKMQQDAISKIQDTLDKLVKNMGTPQDQKEKNQDCTGLNETVMDLDTAATEKTERAHFVKWPVTRIYEEHGVGVKFTEKETNEGRDFIKEERRNKHGETKDRTWIREFLGRLGALAFAQRYDGRTILNILRQSIRGEVLEYLTNLQDAGGKPERIWYQWQRSCLASTTPAQAAKALQEFRQSPPEVTLDQVNLKIVNLTRIKHGSLTSSPRDKLRFVEACIDELNTFLQINVQMKWLVPIVESKYNAITSFLREQDQIGTEPTNASLDAFDVYFTSLLSVPYLKDMVFKPPKKSSSAEGHQHHNNQRGGGSGGPRRHFSSSGQNRPSGQDHRNYNGTGGGFQAQSNYAGPQENNQGYNRPPPQLGNWHASSVSYQDIPTEPNHHNYIPNNHNNMPNNHNNMPHQGWNNSAVEHGPPQGEQGHQQQEQRSSKEQMRPPQEQYWEYPSDMNGNCYNCNRRYHSSKYCRRYNGEFPLPPHPSNRCDQCGGYHRRRPCATHPS